MASSFALRASPLASAAVVALVVAAGDLECSHVEPKVARGAELYRRTCAVCHGAEGQGYKADEAPAIGFQAFLSTASDDFLREAIANGRAGTTMSAWARQRGGPLSPEDVEAVIAFLRSWETGPRPELDERPLTGDAGAGANTFARECARCHGMRGVGGKYVHVGNPRLLKTASNGFLRHAIKHGRPGTEMRSFAEAGDSVIEDLVAALRQWENPPPSEPIQWAQPAPPLPIPLGPVPLNPKGPEPVGFQATPQTTPADVIKAQLDRGAKMAILDARAPSDYMNEHIAGAVSVPFYDPDPYFDKLPKNTWLVCYCSCPSAESGALCRKLQEHGFKKTTVLAEGIGYWRMKSYGTRSGDKP